MHCSLSQSERVGARAFPLGSFSLKDKRELFSLSLWERAGVRALPLTLILLHKGDIGSPRNLD